MLREQNAKCNVQLELLRGRLAQLSTMHTDQDAQVGEAGRGGRGRAVSGGLLMVGGKALAFSSPTIRCDILEPVT